MQRLNTRPKAVASAEAEVSLQLRVPLAVAEESAEAAAQQISSRCRCLSRAAVSEESVSDGDEMGVARCDRDVTDDSGSGGAANGG